MDKTNNNSDFFESKNNYKKDDNLHVNINIIEKIDKQIDNDNNDSKLIKSNSDELSDYDIIESDEINKIKWLGYV